MSIYALYNQTHRINRRSREDNQRSVDLLHFDESIAPMLTLPSMYNGYTGFGYNYFVDEGKHQFLLIDLVLISILDVSEVELEGDEDQTHSEPRVSLAPSLDH